MRWLKIAIYTGVSAGWIWLGAEPSIQVVVAKREQFGSVDCLDEKVSLKEREVTSCELSAVVYLGDGRLMLANDQLMPEKIPSAVFWIGVPEVSQRHIAPKGYVRQPAVAQARKFEELTLTPKGTLIAMTGHDRYVDQEPRFDAYCQLVSWDWQAPGFALSISGLNRDGKEIALRHAMAQALTPKSEAQLPYLKVEGLTVLPHQKLLLGVREVGQDYDHCMNDISFLQIGYDEPARGYLQLTSDFQKVYSMTASEQLMQLKDYPQVQANYKPTGISSLLYEAEKKRVYFMTTSEGRSELLPSGYERKSLDGYLWWLSLEDLEAHRLARPVLDEKKEPLHFLGHKPEGMTFLPDGKLFIICDEDRVESSMNLGEPKRNQQESPYYIYSLSDQ